MSEDRVITIEITARTKDGGMISAEAFVDDAPEESPDPDMSSTGVMDAVALAGLELCKDLQERGLM